MRRPSMASGWDAKKAWYDSGGCLNEAQRGEAREIVERMFPLRDRSELELAVERVQWLLDEFVRARNARVDDFAQPEARRVAAGQLRALVAATTTDPEFEAGKDELSSLARAAVFGYDQDDPCCGAIAAALRVGHEDLRKFRGPTRRDSGKRRFRAFALQMADQLEIPLGRGRPPKASVNAFTQKIMALWEQFTDEPSRPDQRATADENGDQWPVRDFITALGRIVDPEFTAAARPIYDAQNGGHRFVRWFHADLVAPDQRGRHRSPGDAQRAIEDLKKGRLKLHLHRNYVRDAPPQEPGWDVFLAPGR